MTTYVACCEPGGLVVASGRVTLVGPVRKVTDPTHPRWQQSPGRVPVVNALADDVGALVVAWLKANPAWAAAIYQTDAAGTPL
jgi:hypothetical protein